MSAAVWFGVAAFAIGTYALRFGGVRVMQRAGRRAHLSVARTRLLTAMVAALLAAVAVASAVVDDHGFTGIDRLLGVAVGGLFAVRGAPLVVTLVVAAVMTAVIRLVVGH